MRRLLLTWVQFCSSTAWAGAGWVGDVARTGASPRARTEAGAGTGARAGTGASPGAGTGPRTRLGTENQTGLSLYACFAIVVRLTRTRQFLA